MFGTLGGPEIVLILVIALIVFGPRKLPEIGKTMGKMLAEFRKASTDFKRTIEDEVESEKVVLPPPAPAPVVAADSTAPPELTTRPPDTPTVSRDAAIEPPAPMETPSRLEPPVLADAPSAAEPATALAADDDTPARPVETPETKPA
jgi:TatA/E family protein of Tat protein translocase